MTFTPYPKPEKKPKEKPKPIRNRAPKRAADERTYSIDGPAWLEINDTCQRCGCPSEQIHHMDGRSGKMLLKKERWMALCAICHDWVEHHPKEAKANNFSGSKIKSDGKN